MKHILLAVAGLSPQVITETLFALHQENKSVDAIEIITTKVGKEKCVSLLLSEGQGAFYNYLADYNINQSNIDFSIDDIHVVLDEYGNPVEDILTESDNQKFLALCLERTWYWTRDPNVSLYFSIAGGRKTMSACLTLAAHMYGRPQDRLYHVMLSPEFEHSTNFFFPPAKDSIIELKNAQGETFWKDSSYAKVCLAQIPFVSIRKHLSDEVVTGPLSPAELISSLITEDSPCLVVNIAEKNLQYGDIECDLQPAPLALYAMFVLHKVGQNCPHSNGICDQCSLSYQEVYEKNNEVAEIFQKISNLSSFSTPSDTGITSLSSENFNSYKSKIKNKLVQAFGQHLARQFEISSIGSKPNTRYGITLTSSRIRVKM